MAGTLLLDGSLVARTTGPVAGSRLAQISRLIEETLATKPRSQRIADRASAYFAVGIIVVAVVSLAVRLALGRPAPGSLHRRDHGACGRLPVRPRPGHAACPHRVSEHGGSRWSGGAQPGGAGAGRQGEARGLRQDRHHHPRPLDSRPSRGPRPRPAGTRSVAAARRRPRAAPALPGRGRRAVLRSTRWPRRSSPPARARFLTATDFEATRGRGCGAVLPSLGERRVRVGSPAYLGLDAGALAPRRPPLPSKRPPPGGPRSGSPWMTGRSAPSRSATS